MRKVDPNSPEWFNIKIHLQTKREECREELEDVNCTTERTSQLRGYVMCIKDILALADESPEVIAPDNYE